MEYINRGVITDGKVSIDEAAYLTLPRRPPIRIFDLVQRRVAHAPFDEAVWDATMAPRVSVALHPFQREAVFRMVTERRVLNASSMGLGKTVQSIVAAGIVRESPEQPELVLCPGYLCDNWAREVARFAPGVTSRIFKGGKDDLRALLYDPGIKIVSYETAAILFAKLTRVARGRMYFRTVICDESHMLKNHRSKRFEMLHAVIRAADNVFLLSGTPAPNRCEELFAQFSLLEDMGPHEAFAVRYCGATPENGMRTDGASHTRELAFLSSLLMIRLRREDHVAHLLPPFTRARVDLPPPGNAEFFARGRARMRALARSGDSLEAQALASAMFLETARAKVPAVLAYLAGNLTDEKTIVWVVHHDMHAAIASALASTLGAAAVVGITGATTKRDAALQRFLTDDAARVAVLTVGSCATGYNLAPVRRMVFAELCWTPATLSQCEARVLRLTPGAAREAVTFVYLVSDGTLDEFVFNKLVKKNATAVEVVDRNRDYGDFAF